MADDFNLATNMLENLSKEELDVLAKIANRLHCDNPGFDPGNPGVDPGQRAGFIFF
ncbi:hypothetical protein P4647_25535 [Peribacillus frigoritolerans]|uniref:hypothetical protein n=1 Tax=Peribacillus frigoritolerans TaxID=450367 RepID=UPI002E1E12DD|nr:hypothetical protein [Peribacillus frigoritolerans]